MIVLSKLTQTAKKEEVVQIRMTRTKQIYDDYYAKKECRSYASKLIFVVNLHSI